MRISRRGLIIGAIFGIAATLSGIFVIKYTEGLFLVVVLWIVIPVMLVQLARHVKSWLGKV